MGAEKFLLLLLVVVLVEGTITSKTSATYTTKSGYFSSGALTGDGTILVAAADNQTTSIYALTATATSITLKSTLNLTKNCASNLVYYAKNTQFFHICNSNNNGPTTFSLIEYNATTSKLTLLKNVTVASDRGYFSPASAIFPDEEKIYLIANTGSEYNLHIFDVSTFVLKIFGSLPIVNSDQVTVSNYMVSIVHDYLVIFLYRAVNPILVKYLLPSLTQNATWGYNEGDFYVFQYSTNSSLSNFMLGPTDNGIIYQNFDYDIWVAGADLLDNNTCFYDSGVNFIRSSTDQCFYVCGGQHSSSGSTVSQISLTTPLAAPQAQIGQIKVSENQLTALGANSEAVFISSGTEICAHRVDCTGNTLFF